MYIDLYARKKPESEFSDKIGSFFTEHNIISYINPYSPYLFGFYKDIFSIIYFLNEIGFLIPASSVSLTVFTTKYPQKLLNLFNRDSVKQTYMEVTPGLIRLNFMGYNVQIIRINRLAAAKKIPDKYMPLCLLRNNFSKQDLERTQMYVDTVCRTHNNLKRQRVEGLCEPLTRGRRICFKEVNKNMNLVDELVQERYGDTLDLMDRLIATKDQLLDAKDQLLATIQKLDSLKDAFVHYLLQEVERKNDCARTLIRNGVSLDVISEATGLSPEALQKLTNDVAN